MCPPGRWDPSLHTTLMLSLSFCYLLFFFMACVLSFAKSYLSKLSYWCWSPGTNWLLPMEARHAHLKCGCGSNNQFQIRCTSSLSVTLTIMYKDSALNVMIPALLKIIIPHLSLLPRESKRSLLEEGNIMATLNHERVVKLLGVIMEDKDCSLVLELIPRGNLLVMLQMVSRFKICK